MMVVVQAALYRPLLPARLKRRPFTWLFLTKTGFKTQTYLQAKSAKSPPIRSGENICRLSPISSGRCHTGLVRKKYQSSNLRAPVSLNMPGKNTHRTCTVLARQKYLLYLHRTRPTKILTVPAPYSHRTRSTVLAPFSPRKKFLTFT